MRVRGIPSLREAVAETRLQISDFVLPIFVREGRGVREPIEDMPGVSRVTPELVDVPEGIGGVLLFGVPASKDAGGTGAFRPDGPVPHAVKRIKERHPGVFVATDVCLCAYTDHGHCGILVEGARRLDVDRTLKALGAMAVVHARAGADVVAPSAMMDGQVAAIREALDEAGFGSVAIMAYSAKYASAFYGPFRAAANSAPSFGDRSSYQMDPRNVDEAMREITLDIEQGADIVMVKPALAYLDVIREARRRFLHPIAAYNVSGEYAMVKAAAERGWVEEKRAALEILTAIKRAGARVIISYWAGRMPDWLG